MSHEHAVSCALSHGPLSHETPPRVAAFYRRARPRKPHFTGISRNRFSLKHAVSCALSHEAPPFVPEGAASRSRTQHLGLKSRNTKKAQATKDRRRAAARRSVHAD